MNIKIIDPYGRTFPYLRLSVTEVCNFSCSYCLPNGYQKTGREKKYLNLNEINRLVTAFAELGVQKVRLTGGEPTVRADLCDIASTIFAIKGIQTVALTTNGYKLPQKAKALFDAGVRHINISIDSLKPKKFYKITKHNRLAEVLKGLDKCLALGFKKIKVNTVLLKDENADEIDDFFNFVKEKKVDWRFIELMHTTDNVDYFEQQHLRSRYITEKLLAAGWQQQKRCVDAGPANTFSHINYKGKIGLIQPYKSNFCEGCNRLRVSAYGELQLCLFGEGRIDLRPWLQEDGQKDSLKKTIQKALRMKPEHHFLHEKNAGATPYLASIGG